MDRIKYLKLKTVLNTLRNLKAYMPAQLSSTAANNALDGFDDDLAALLLKTENALRIMERCQ